MSTLSSDFRKYLKEHFFKVILIMLFLLSTGYIMLFKIATWEDPFLGNTFHIVFGCLLIFIPLIITAVAIKVRFLQKKKKRSHKPIFLKKN